MTHARQNSNFGNLVLHDGNPSVAYSNALTPEEFVIDLEQYWKLREVRSELLFGLMGNPLTRSEVAAVFRAKKKLEAATRLFKKKVLDSLSLIEGSNGHLYIG